MNRKNKIEQLLYSKKIKFIISNMTRIHVITLFFLGFCFIIVLNLFSYTVLDAKFYKDLADKQQIWKVVIPVTRGTIYSSGTKETMISTSLNLYNVSVDPQMDWDKEKLSFFLQDLVYKQICYLKSRKVCKNNLFKFLRVLDIEWFVHNEENIKKLLSENIEKKLYQEKVVSVFLDKQLSESQILNIINMWLPWIYPRWNYVYANPEEIMNLSDTAEKLSYIIPYTKKDLEYLLRQRTLKYIPIINKLSIHLSEFLKKYISDENKAIKKWILDLDNSISRFFILEPKPNRFYPEDSLAAQIIWFVDREWVWHYWLEWQFNWILKWNNWKIVSRKDIMWRIIDPISLEKEDLIWEWADIVTTIDRNIQKKVEEILEDWVKKYRANKWTVVVMNPRNGNIISMANYPSYNLNNFWDVYELEKVKYSKYPTPEIDLLWYPVFVEDTENGSKYFYDNKEIYLRSSVREELADKTLVKYKYKNDFWAQVYKNDAISSLYEPWSIMKAITVAIWLDTWEIDESSMYMDKWEVSIDNFKIANVSDKCLWYNSFAHALNYSCNVWMIRIVQRVGKVLMYQYFNEFWFWEITWIDLYWEVFSKIKAWERWSKAQLLTSSYWLWISVTPLQMASAYSTLANWWIKIKPNILKQIKHTDWKIQNYTKEEQSRVISKSTSDLIKKMLVDSVSNWVAKTWWVEWYSVAWKTWTSQIPYKWKYEKWVWSTVWSYAWFWPAEDPRFVIIVKLVRPRTNEYWGKTSAFIFKDIASYLFDYYWIPKKNN
jgi:cell division protein FtsI/penicillin-binding protein 2